jgi:predicted amidohydrolase YtcJ
VVIQPVFLREFGDALAYHFGADRVDWSIRQQSLLDAGVVVAASSDRPVAPGAPLLGVQAMVERLTATGAAYGARERVAVEEALRAYTSHAAYAAGVEHEVGTMRSRQRADLVVLDADPTSVDTAAIGEIRVLATLVDGEPVHDPGHLFA